MRTFAIVALLAIPLAMPAADIVGRYAKDKKAFFPGGRNADKEAFYAAALAEGEEKREPYPPLPGEPQIAADYDAAAFLAKTFGAGFSNYGVMLGRLGRWKEAEVMFQRASSAPKVPAGLWGQLGVARHALGRHAEAVEAFARALALDPDYFKDRPTQARCRQGSLDGRPAI